MIHDSSYKHYLSGRYLIPPECIQLIKLVNNDTIFFIAEQIFAKEPERYIVGKVATPMVYSNINIKQDLIVEQVVCDLKGRNAYFDKALVQKDFENDLDKLLKG